MNRDELLEAALDAYDAAETHEEGIAAVIDVVEAAFRQSEEAGIPIQTKGTSVAAEPLFRNLNGTGPTPGRSVRISDEIWDAAKARAADEGVSISQVIVLLAWGYAHHAIDLPDVSVQHEAS